MQQQEKMQQQPRQVGEESRKSVFTETGSDKDTSSEKGQRTPIEKPAPPQQQQQGTPAPPAAQPAKHEPPSTTKQNPVHETPKKPKQ